MRLPLLLLALSAPACAALQPISEAPVAVEEDSDCLHNADNSVDCVHTRQYTILKEAGKEMLSRIVFDLDGGDRMEFRSGEVRQPDGRVLPLSQAQIITRDAPNVASGLGGGKQTWLAFPELTVGSVIRYQYQEHSAPLPLSRELWLPAAPFAQARRYDGYRLNIRSERPLFWRGEQLSELDVASSLNGKQLTFTLKSPHYLRYTNEWGNAYIRHWPRINISTSDQAQAHFAPYAERYNAILAAPLPPKAAAVVAAQQGKPAAEQVAAFMQHINSQYRYLNDLRLAERGWVPFKLDEIEQHGYGDCKDLSTLLAAMLRAAGIAAEPALIHRGVSAPELLLPGPGNFNHMIVRAEVDGQTWWLDATNPYFTPGRIPDDLQERTAFRVARDGGIVPEQLPAAPPSLERIRREEALQTDGSAHIVWINEMRGAPLEELAMRDRYQGSSSADKRLCNDAGIHPQNCQVERAATTYRQPEQYTARSQWDDKHAVDKISGLYLYNRSLEKIWNDYDSYRDNAHHGDIYLQNLSNREFDVLLKGARSLQADFRCQAHSRWFDVALKQKTEAAGVHYQYLFARKARWLSHEDIVSPEFIAFGNAARDCVGQARQLLRLSAPAAAAKPKPPALATR